MTSGTYPWSLVTQIHYVFHNGQPSFEALKTEYNLRAVDRLVNVFNCLAYG